MEYNKILCADLTAEIGHVEFNRLVLYSLAQLGELTIAAPESYLTNFPNVQHKISLPNGLHQKGPGHILHRANQALRWIRMRKILSETSYDAIVILGYEPLTSAVFAHGTPKIWSIEHNTIDSILNSQIKLNVFKKLPISWQHFVFFEYIRSFLWEATGRTGATLPHPLLQSPSGTLPVPRGFPVANQVVFSPSRSNDKSSIKLIEQTLAGRPDSVFVSKGRPSDSSRNVCLRTHFDDYIAWLQHSDVIYFSGNFHYRASGVVFDALSQGTPVVLTDSLMGRKLHELYPSAVQIVRKVSDLFDVQFNRALVLSDCEKLWSTNSAQELTKVFADSLFS